MYEGPKFNSKNTSVLLRNNKNFIKTIVNINMNKIIYLSSLISIGSIRTPLFTGSIVLKTA